MVEVTAPSRLLEVPDCGNGSEEPGEECDDNNRRNGDGCDTACRVEEGVQETVDAGAAPPPSCGNGKLERRRGEQCDDGNNAAGDGCGAFCLEEPGCGNGVIEVGEQCEPPGTVQCDDHCGTIVIETSECGDGILGGYESCDDGNLRNGDECSRYCTVSPVCGNGKIEHNEDCEPPGLGECGEDCRYPGEPGCGNARVDDYMVVIFGVATRIIEECDDGNLVDDDGCNSDCASVVVAEDSTCGNGTVEGDEECDDGNFFNNDGCSSSCREMEIEGCPNGVVEADEDCDDGNFFNNDGCSSSCGLETLQGCPNGVVEADEDCDDGNFFNNDGCSARCEVEPACGDGTRDPGEQCDDGNLVDDDGCSSSCITEIVAAVWPNSTHLCGNGSIDPGETCDDRNRVSGDGCSPTCQTFWCGDAVVNGDEACDNGVNNTVYDAAGNGCAFQCQRPGYCGDGTRQFAQERCDDGNLVDGDGCSKTCQRESTCGNGIIEFDEECDDPNGLEPILVCTALCTVLPPPECGDQLVQAATETCDDGNFIPGDGCSAACQLEECGNRVLDPGEECEESLGGEGLDAGVTDAGAEDALALNCSDTCEFLPTCGDGFLSKGEDCDDENQVAGDGCSPTCDVEPRCGDGNVDSGEQCDDRNLVVGDGCSPTCTNEPACGDGVKEGSEVCDDGNLLNGDGCSSKCRAVGTAQEVANGLRNGNFDTNLASWTATDSSITLSHNSTNDVAASPTSGSIKVRFWVQQNSPVRATAGGSQCVAAAAGQALELEAWTQIPTTSPTSARANVFARFYASADCSGTMLPEQAGPFSTGSRGTWVKLGGALLVPQGTSGVQVRLEVSKVYSDPAADILFDGVSLTGEEEQDEPPRCGDLLVNVTGEECDDGNLQAGDGCDATCQNEAVCGDGTLDTTEQCDDGNLQNGDSCSRVCTPSPVCGNGTKSDSEECDDSNTQGGDGCSRLCLNERVCGDGLLVGDEECDDANVLSQDGCSTRCEIEPLCGNGILEGNDRPANEPWWRREQCDDGNQVNGDGCTQLCTTEVAGESCGNGLLQPSLGEQCEFSPAVEQSAMCRSNCTPSCLACRTTQCKDPLAACQQATGVAEEGPAKGERKAELCTALLECMQNNELECKGADLDGPWSPESCLCGLDEDGTRLTSAEHAECRQGVRPAGGECSEEMAAAAETTDTRLILERLFEPEIVLASAFSLGQCSNEKCKEVCTFECGNGFVEGDEECDDGNDIGDDDCNECLTIACGNGRRDPGEDCDPGDPEDEDVCNDQCEFKLGCGDGVINGHLLPGADLPPPDAGIVFVNEECDDGNRRDEDGCDQDCQYEYCGDGILQPDLPIREWNGQGTPPDVPIGGQPEECDGADVNGVPCAEACRLEFGCDACLQQRCDPGWLAAREDCTAATCPLMTALEQCIETTGCAYQNDGYIYPDLFLPICVCGTYGALDCAGGYANGPCLNQAAAAAESSNPLDIILSYVDPNYPIGAVGLMYTCRAGECEEECRRTNP